MAEKPNFRLEKIIVETDTIPRTGKGVVFNKTAEKYWKAIQGDRTFCFFNCDDCDDCQRVGTFLGKGWCTDVTECSGMESTCSSYSCNDDPYCKHAF